MPAALLPKVALMLITLLIVASTFACASRSLTKDDLTTLQGTLESFEERSSVGEPLSIWAVLAIQSQLACARRSPSTV